MSDTKTEPGPSSSMANAPPVPQNPSGFSITVPQPPLFLVAPGDPSIPFRTWRKLANNYFSAISFQIPLPEEQKVRLLIPLLGAEGGRIYFNLPETPDANKTLATELDKLEGHFAPQANPIAARVAFRSRVQTSGEAFESFYTELRQLVKDCDFDTQDREDEELRDMVVQGVLSKETRTRLLRQGRDLTLTNALTTCRQVEQASAESQSISKGLGSSRDSAKDAQVAKVGQSKRRGAAAKKQKSTSQKNTSGRVCYRCKSVEHVANFAQCPARNSECRDCKVIGHYAGARYCRGKPATENAKPPPKPQNSAARGVSAESECEVLAVQNTRKKIFTSLKLQSANGQVVCKFLVDTGSDVSMISHAQYLAHFKAEQLQPCLKTLRNYDGSVIKNVHGVLPQVVIWYGGKVATVDFYVIPDNYYALLGLDIIKSCELVIDGKSLSVRAVSRESIIETHPKLFQDGIGCVSKYCHKIELRPDAIPFIAKDREIPISIREKADKTIEEYVKMGIFEPAEGVEWLHPLVIVDKKNDKNVRVCVDLGHLNDYVIPDRFPLPNPDEIILQLSGSTVFSKLDLRSAFFHLPLTKESRPLTAFMHRKFGVLQHTRLPMGYTASPSVFQKFMHRVLGGLPGVVPFIDDILVHGKTTEDHDENLERTLCALEEMDLRLKPEKLRLRVPKVEFLGHIISAEGISPNQDGKVAALRSAPAPMNKKELRSFLGLASYYLKFVQNFATISEPLRLMTHDRVPFLWTEEAQTAFDCLKQMVCSGPTLGIFSPSCATFVSTDASDVGLGAVLSQNQGEKEIPVAFASHVLSPAERKYSTGGREALSCVWACEKWYKYLIGRKFTLRTDHQALIALLKRTGRKAPALGRIDRWYRRLLKFDFNIVFRPGSKNQPADALSRLPSPDEFDFGDDDSEFVCFATSDENALGTLSIADVQAATDADTVLAQVRHYVENEWPRKNKIDVALLPYFRLRDELFIAENCVFRIDVQSGNFVNRLVIPSELQKKVIDLAHEGHPGIVRTKQRIRELYWWPGYDSQIENFVKSCIPCHESGKGLKPEKVPVTPVDFPSKPWEKLAIDVIGPFETAPLHAKYLVVVTDYYSKWPEVSACSEVTSAVVIKNLNIIFSREGYPEDLVSDNGPQFTSREFEGYLAENGIHHSHTAVYNPTANGLVERCNRWLKEGAQAYYVEGVTLVEAVRKMLIAYRATPHSVTGKSPSELLHGRKMRTKLDIFPKAPAAVTMQDHSEVRSKVKSSQQKYDSRADTDTHKFSVGDLVQIQRSKIRHVPKGRPPLSKPLRVVQIKGNHSYRLSDGKVWNSRKLVPSLPAEIDDSVSDADIGLDEHFPPKIQPIAPEVPIPNLSPGLNPPRRAYSERVNKGVPPRRLIEEM